ncbi:MarR family winged helix-turn-helix transcriptional regulator [Rugosimonospora africana]|nr:MarR family transcriptional regulator [Rugosimonospora africana]
MSGASGESSTGPADDPERVVAARDVERGVSDLYRKARSRARGLHRDIHPALTPLGFAVLRLILDEEPMRGAAIASTLGLDKAIVSRQTAILRDIGLVEALPDPEDGRATLFVSSDAAKKAFEAFRAQAQDEYRDILQSWTTEDIVTFGRLLGQFNRAIANWF